MRIIFICGSLEPGKDGVGDYTRRLAGELMRQNVQVGMLSYNDTFIQDELQEEQVSENINISSLRLPSIWSSSKRKNFGRKWIQQHNPEWLSLQFVPYSFNKKGLPFGFAQQLKYMGGNIKWHIMFHELWLGLRINDSLKYRVVGSIQKFLIKSLKNKINVQAVHTHTQLYLRELIKLKFNPEYLHLFGNIPFHKKPDDNNILTSSKESFVMFGSIHPNAPTKQFAKEVSRYFNEKVLMKSNLILVGRLGNEQQEWVHEFKAEGIEVTVLGELSAQDISNVLQESSFGITTNPSFVVEKSGTVAAMREHGLPILVVSEDTRPKDDLDFDLPNGFWEYKEGNFSNFMMQKSTNPVIIDISEITNNFVQVLFKS